MIDRRIHHPDILSLKGDSYRLRGKDLGPRPPPADLPDQRTTGGRASTLKRPSFQPAKPALFSSGLDNL
jgi:hypothetical protein